MKKSYSKHQKAIIRPLYDWVIRRMRLFLDFELPCSAFWSFYEWRDFSQTEI